MDVPNGRRQSLPDVIVHYPPANRMEDPISTMPLNVTQTNAFVIPEILYTSFIATR